MKVRPLILAVALVACGPPGESAQPERPAPTGFRPSAMEVERATTSFHELRDDFLPWYYETWPVRASELGVLDHLALLPALDRGAIQDRIDGLLDRLARLELIPFLHLEGDDRYDYGIMEYALRGELLELEEVRGWVRDPRVYTGVIARGIASAADAGASEADRVAAVASRMEAAAGVLEAARENLSSPPELWTGLAIDDTRDLGRYLQAGLPAAFGAPAGSAALPSDLRGPRDRLVTALERHERWLRDDLQPRSTGSYRLGRYLLERRLLYGDHIALSVDELERINESALVEYQALVEEVAAEIDPDRSVAAIMDSLAADRPPADQLTESAVAMMRALRDWTTESRVVPLPEAELPRPRAAPAWTRRTDAATLDGGAAGEGPVYLDLVSVAPDTSEGRAGESPVVPGRAELLSSVAHATYPGRYVQRLYEDGIESELRRTFTPRAFEDGWAHYAEQLVQEAGYQGSDTALRLGQLRRALERHARWYAALHLHAFDTPMEEVVERFQALAYVDEAEATREVIRATYDPAYLADALGRLQIMELRRDYAEYLAEDGDTLSLGQFHEELLSLVLPLPLAREALIPEQGQRRVQARRDR